YYEFTETKSDGTTETVKSPTYGQMKNAVTTAIKGLYNYWLGESAKLNYDSLGLALNGQTIGICFCTGGEYNEFSADTESIRKDTLPADNIIIGICLYSYGILNPQFVGDSSQTENFRYDTKGAVITNYGEEDAIYFDKDVDTYSISTYLNDF
ncbi:MAG: hypothetical protein IJS29_05105, partial [Selenomonadaceae bacterium]|nr:hypothetical protein [Selenomonadaceae bacterium]